jgi:glucose/arabinose dehydrogenase
MFWNVRTAGTVTPRRSSTRAFRPALEMLEDRTTPVNLPSGFTDTLVASGLSGPTAMEFAPDGRLFVLEQAGNVKLVRPDGTTFTALHLSVDSAGERGVLGIAFDPNFASNHFVYLYYTNPNAGGAPWATGEHNQLSRFTVNDANPQQPTFANEAPILDWNNLSSATNHNGGAIHFGTDGMLYADAGDNVQTFTGPDGNSYRVSQTLNNLLGKQIRIDVAKFNSGVATRDDTAVGHLIPSDNPFVGTATGINQLIYVLGLRNPFTFAVQPGAGRIFINDVGESTWEEIDDSIAGANYGWRGGASDGFGHPPPSFAPGTYHDPLLAYNHTGGPAGGGAAIVGGTFYNPATAQFPANYAGKYFYEDLAAGWIRVFDPANPGSASNPDTSTGFATGTAGGLRDLKVDSVGNLFYLAGADGTVHKISYQAPQITAQPTDRTVTQGQTATLSVTATGPSLSYQWQHLVGSTWTNVGTSSNTLAIPNAQPADAGSYRVVVSNTFGSVTSNTANLTVSVAGTAPTITTQPSNQQANVGQPATFTVAASGTAPLTYQWQHLVGSTWTNVGTNSATFTISSVTTADAGSYRVIVSNSIGSATSNTATLAVNQLPVVTITAPSPSLTYNFGQTVNFAGSATDPEDGTLAVSQLSWEIRFYHEDAPDGTGLHFHPFKTFSGVGSGSIVTDFPETSPLVWYRFILTATDSQGATASTSVDVHPNTATFTLASNPSGLQLLLDGGPIAGGTSITGVVGQPRTIGVVSPQTAGNTTYTFASWSDGGAASHTINTPATNTTFTANFTTAPVGTGLAATYWNNINFTGSTVRRTDPTVNFNFETGSPDPAIAPDTFSARWTGLIQPRFSQTYTFFTTSDDGVRLWVNGKLVINDWTDHTARVDRGMIALVAGQKYDIRMDYYENSGLSVVKLKWQSASQAREVVPQSQLFTGPPAGTIKINFQDRTSAGKPGYLADTGAVFGDRGNGQSYGWNQDNSANARNRNVSLIQDERFDTFTHMQMPSNPNAFWEIAVPNGTYQVRVVSGDPGAATNAVYKINVEGVLAVDSVAAPAPGRFFVGTVTVTVTDGRLTVSNAAEASNNKISFIEITPL